jgi:hypothetical protein
MTISAFITCSETTGRSACDIRISARDGVSLGAVATRGYVLRRDSAGARTQISVD